MTNEEKANELIAGDESINISTVRFLIKDKVLQMAKWKDEQHKKEIADLRRKLNAEKELRKQVEDSVRGLPQPIKELIKAMNMII